MFFSIKERANCYEKNKTKKVDKNFVLELTDDEMRTFGKVKSKNLLDFLSFRGIDIENLPSDAIAECKGYFAFVYKLNNKVKMIKFAKAEEKNFWQRQGGIPVLFNIDNTDKSKSLLITEGEWDALCLLGLGIKNVCSVPLGVSNLEWIEKVSSKGGTTEAALNLFHSHDLNSKINEGIIQANARAKELGKVIDK